jgi:hypothetical protein
MASAKISCFETAEQRHARPKFHVFRRARNNGCGLFACSHDEARAFEQASPEQVMLQVSDGLSVRADREALSHRAEAETGHLQKDEPHPVRLFVNRPGVDRRSAA